LNDNYIKTKLYLFFFINYIYLIMLKYILNALFLIYKYFIGKTGEIYYNTNKRNLLLIIVVTIITMASANLSFFFMQV